MVNAALELSIICEKIIFKSQTPNPYELADGGLQSASKLCQFFIGPSCFRMIDASD